MLGDVFEKTNGNASQEVTLGVLAARRSGAPIIVKIGAADERLVARLGVVGALLSGRPYWAPEANEAGEEWSTPGEIGLTDAIGLAVKFS